jgi:RNA polymerase sigma factor (sigma-70 family)
MADGQLALVINQLRRLVRCKSGCTLTDAQLLDAFITRRDEASFEVLVWRHGTMVLRLCQRILHDSHEAEDAFQATFLVFASKAHTIGKRESVGSWLHKVAYRIALRVRARAVKRGAPVESAGEIPAPESAHELLWRDLRPILDEEIDRLPEKYRAPVVLCYLQGHTNEEAAEQLGCPKGTIQSRLARGRERLQARLTRRGVALSAGSLAMILSPKATAVPAGLVSSTVAAALSFAAGKGVVGLVSASVAALTEGVLHAMFLTKLKITAAALLALAILGTGTGLFAHRSFASRPVPAEREPIAERPAEKPAGGGERSTEKRADRADVKSAEVAGAVVAVAKDGKSFTLTVPSRMRGEEPKKVSVKIEDKTSVTYFNVAPNGARPTAGYVAQVRLKESGKDEAVSVLFHGPEDALQRRPDVTGKVVARAKDNKGITVEITPARGRGDDIREGKKVELKFNDKTVIHYSSITRTGDKLTEGYTATVWLEDGPKGNTAGSVHLYGKAGIERGRRRGDIAGKVIARAKDGKTITLEVPGKTRGDEPTKIEIKIGDKTSVVYYNVTAGGTKVVEGLQAEVWLEEGSRDSAVTVGLIAVPKLRWPLILGKVVGVSKDGKTITLEVPPRTRREEPKPFDVKITPRTRVAYSGVGPDGAKPAEGYMAAILLDDAKDARGVLFSKPGSGRGR